MFGMFFLGSLYLRRILGYDPLQIGLAFLPAAVVMGVLSVRYTDRLVMRFGARRLLFPGLGLIAAGLALFAMTPGRRDVPELRLPGPAADRHRRRPVLPRADDAGHVHPAPDAGLASGLVNTTAQVGGALGLAVLATVSASRTNALIAHGRPVAVALTDGYHLAFWIAFGLVVAAIAVAATVLRQGPAAAAPPASVEAMQEATLAGVASAGCAD